MALLFSNGSSQVVNCGSGASLDNLSAGTVLIWHNKITSSAINVMTAKMDNSGSFGWIFYTDGSTPTLRFELKRSSAHMLIASNSNPIPSGVWSVTAVTWDTAGVNSDQKLFRGGLTTPLTEVSTYIDQSAGSGSQLDDSSYNLGIGNVASIIPSFTYNGHLGNVIIWNTQLTESELQQQQWYSFPIVKCSNVVATYILGLDGTGIQVDYSGNGNDGTVTGASKSSTHPGIIFAPLSISIPKKAITIVSASISDGIKSSDTPLRTAIFDVVSNDGIKGGDSDTTLAQFQTLLSDGTKFGETISSLLTTLGASSDGIKLSDTTLATILQLILGTVIDGIKAGDSSSVSTLLQGIVADGIKFSEFPRGINILTFATSDGVKLSDSALGALLFLVAASDGIDLSDTPLASIFGGILATVTDGVVLSDSDSVQATFYVSVSDGAQFGEVLLNIATIAAAIADGIKISDSTTGSTFLAVGEISIKLLIKNSSIDFIIKKPEIDYTIKKPDIKLS